MSDPSNAEVFEQAQRLLENEDYGRSAIARLDEADSADDFAEAFYELWTEKNGASPAYGDDRQSLWELTLKHLRLRFCGADDSLRTQIETYRKNAGSAPLLTGVVFYLVSAAGLPIDPMMATVVILYILKFGLDVFCEYTEPQAEKTLPSSDSR